MNAVAMVMTTALMKMESLYVTVLRIRMVGMKKNGNRIFRNRPRFSIEKS